MSKKESKKVEEVVEAPVETRVALLPLETVNLVLSYLGTQPFQTVAQLINEIQTKVQLVEKK